MQSFRCCHCADIHPEHVHSLRRPGALWISHVSEDITRLGGGTDAQLTHRILTFVTQKNDASLSSWELNSTPNKWCSDIQYFTATLHSYHSMDFFLNLNRTIESIVRTLYSLYCIRLSDQSTNSRKPWIAGLTCVGLSDWNSFRFTKKPAEQKR